MEPNFHQLAIFGAVTRNRSFSKAAEELHITQPAVSIQIQELEKSLGVPLLHRLKRGLQLTDAGEVVYEYAQRMTGIWDEMREAVEDLAQLRRGHLTIGASTTIGEYLLPESLGQFRALYPDVELELSISNTAAIVERVLQHQLDLGVVGTVVEDNLLTVTPYVTDQIVIIASPKHPLAKKGEISVKEVSQEKFILRERGSATRNTAERSAQEMGAELRPAMELGSNEAVKRAVAAGLGLGVVSRYAITYELTAKALCILNVTGWNCQRQFSIIYRRDKHLTSVQRAFLQFVNETHQ